LDRRGRLLGDGREVSQVLETPFGFQIVKVEARRDASRRSLDEVREELRERIHRRSSRRLRRVHAEGAQGGGGLRLAEVPLASPPRHVPDLSLREVRAASTGTGPAVAGLDFHGTFSTTSSSGVGSVPSSRRLINPTCCRPEERIRVRVVRSRVRTARVSRRAPGGTAGRGRRAGFGRFRWSIASWCGRTWLRSRKNSRRTGSRPRVPRPRPAAPPPRAAVGRSAAPAAATRAAGADERRGFLLSEADEQ